jgi:acetyl-CoA decarbonylase/synthase complex subunit gamma
MKTRWGVGRMRYTVEPGIYALGEPDGHSPVVVTANYKMSFDRLRQALAGRDGWIVVLDTKGINVWCAAGKGTFGTEELVRRIQDTGLSSIVRHRRLILPQLSGPGVAAHRVKSLSGFRVVFGPIRAADLPYFLDNGMKTAPGMRRKGFPVAERAVLIPVELVSGLKWGIGVCALFTIVAGLAGDGPFWNDVLDHGVLAFAAILCGITAGAVLTPLLLPWLPGRAFAIKGLAVGVLMSGLLVVFRWERLGSWHGIAELMGWLLMVPALSAYLAMNFTGASTYTSLSGVRKEMRWAVPMEVGLGAAGLILWLGAHLVAQA